jgi:DNA-binding helix-hairpin-helix protein with protein kinase domain
LPAKIYRPHILQERQGELEEKLPLMIALSNDLLLDNAAWPLDVLYDKRTKRLAGFVMKKIEEHKEIHLLYGPKSRIRDFPDAGWNFLIHTAINITRAFELIHNCGHIIGDINARSVLISKQATVRLIDCDSFQIMANGKQFACHVGFPEYTPPELQGRSLHGFVRNQSHDAFGLAVLLFHLIFMGRHPFAGQYLGKGDKDLEESIKEYRFAYGAVMWPIQLCGVHPSKAKAIAHSGNLTPHKFKAHNECRKSITPLSSRHRLVEGLAGVTSQWASAFAFISRSTSA